MTGGRRLHLSPYSKHQGRAGTAYDQFFISDYGPSYRLGLEVTAGPVRTVGRFDRTGTGRDRRGPPCDRPRPHGGESDATWSPWRSGRRSARSSGCSTSRTG